MESHRRVEEARWTAVSFWATFRARLGMRDVLCPQPQQDPARDFTRVVNDRDAETSGDRAGARVASTGN